MSSAHTWKFYGLLALIIFTSKVERLYFRWRLGLHSHRHFSMKVFRVAMSFTEEGGWGTDRAADAAVGLRVLAAAAVALVCHGHLQAVLEAHRLDGEALFGVVGGTAPRLHTHIKGDLHSRTERWVDEDGDALPSGGSDQGHPCAKACELHTSRLLGLFLQKNV